MKFYDWVSQYQWCKSGKGPPIPERYLKDYQTFYHAIVTKILELESNIGTPGDNIIATNNALCEAYWYREDKPYFKVWPEMLEVLSTTRIDIPTKHLVLPYKAFTIQLPEDNELRVDDKYQMRSLLVNEINEIQRDVEAPIKGRRLYVWMDYGEEIQGEPIRAFQRGEFTDREEDSIESCFDLDPHESWYAGVAPDTALRMAILRIVCGVSLLATSSHKVVEPEVLTKHIEQYKSASESRRKELVRKAIARGKHGYRVKNPDHERVLVGSLMDAIRDEHDCAKTGRTLKYSHLRRAHWHIVRCGPQHSQTKVMLFAETEVKKGLPRKEK